MKTLFYSIAFGTTLLFAANAGADIKWLPTSSNYGGTNFVNTGMPDGMGATSLPPGPGVAYGAGFNSNGVFTFGFVGTMVMSQPTFAQTELGSTVLTAGTVLGLEFEKAAADKINYVAMVGDGAQPAKWEYMDSTHVRVMATIVNPVQSASGDLSAAFGLLIDYQNVPALDFKGTLFVTDMHYMDLQPPTQQPTGLGGIAANGTSGVTANFWGFLPLGFLKTFGVDLSNPQDCLGYVDSIAVPAGLSFENKGFDDTLGFLFNDPDNPTNTVLKARVSSSAWSVHNIQFGKLSGPAPTPVPSVAPTSSGPDTVVPVLTVTGSAKKTTKKASTTITGTATDNVQVTAVKYVRLPSKKESKATLTGQNWTIKVKGLKQGKAQKVRVWAVDAAGNQSTPVTVTLRRK